MAEVELPKELQELVDDYHNASADIVERLYSELRV